MTHRQEMDASAYINALGQGDTSEMAPHSLTAVCVRRGRGFQRPEEPLVVNGQFNVTEFGTVKDPEQFEALFAYSPFHHVRDGVKYPAVLLTTGENDGRINPAQSRKMAARLQAATASDLPILFRSTATAGHGIGSSLKDRIAEQADVLAFLFHQLGVDASWWAIQ